MRILAMKTRYLSSFALFVLVGYVLASGCTQDFDVFKPCGTEQKACEGACVDMSDPAFGCGAEACAPCDVANATAACAGTQCVIASCTGTFDNCNNSSDDGCESDPMTDPSNCGGCGNACIAPHATPTCEDGTCAVGECAPDWEDCDGTVENGCEANLLNDPANCGGCAAPCNAFEACQNGQCVLDCPNNMGDCDGDPSNGCETPLNTTTNCGFCGDACNLANATATCSAGMCTIQACNGGFDDCDGMDANGCEADLQSSVLTCGSCNNACPNGPNGTTVCNSGQCAINCTSGFGNCDNDVATGCETDINGSLAHCGMCNQACNPANGTGACMAGSCQVASCTAPFANCDNNPANGCEANTQTSLSHCGMCNMGCSFANAGASCNMGVCALGGCNAGFGNCDGMNANGCETPTTNDPANCGMCGTVCQNAPNAVGACVNSTCGLACNAGFNDCDGMAATGCEVNTSSNVNHCGACGRACSGTGVASKSCTNGLCDSTCDLGFANCTTPAAPAMDNGCEQNAANTNLNGELNCGGCGNSCNSQGNPAADFECDGGNATQKFCACSTNSECLAGGTGTCTANDTCLCGPAGGPFTECAPGEACGAGNACSCNGGAACAMGQTCCVSPAGCKDLQTDPQSCGACGHGCAPGFICNNGACRCDDANDCNTGGGVTTACNSGLCQCNGTPCGVGERCMPNGTCG